MRMSPLKFMLIAFPITAGVGLGMAYLLVKVVRVAWGDCP